MSKIIPWLVEGTGLSEHDVIAIIRNAPLRYRTYPIDKKNGKKRLISQPARELKAFQRILIEKVLNGLSIHECATAYREGVSLRENAYRHVKNQAIKKFDFSNFFPSIKGSDWIEYCKRHSVFDDNVDIDISVRIFFRQASSSSILRLAIGAPSSPKLSNVLMYDFDKRMHDAVVDDKITYTRYADDLTFSATKLWNMNNVYRLLKKVLKEIEYPKLSLNIDKTVVSTKKYKRQITGLIITNDDKVSIGHDRKRLVSSMLYNAIHKDVDDGILKHLQGLIAFINDVEPEFLKALQRRYGLDAVTSIIKKKI